MFISSTLCDHSKILKLYAKVLRMVKDKFSLPHRDVEAKTVVCNIINKVQIHAIENLPIKYYL